MTAAARSRAAIARVARTADHCHGIVTRDFKQDACGKPPVAIIDGAEWDEDYWPACAYHAHRYGRSKCVPLTEVLAAVAEGGTR